MIGLCCQKKSPTNNIVLHQRRGGVLKLELSADDKKFINEVRTFLRDNLDPELAEKVRLGYPVSIAEQAIWTRKLRALRLRPLG